jgi:hypothetical protein
MTLSDPVVPVVADVREQPLTKRQLGAIHGEFRRLGFGDDARAERLAISAALLDLVELDSTTSLVMGEAGRLVGMLRGIRDRAELEAVAAIERERQGDEPGGNQERPGGMSFGVAMMHAAALAFAEWQEWQHRKRGQGIADDSG